MFTNRAGHLSLNGGLLGLHHTLPAILVLGLVISSMSATVDADRISVLHIDDEPDLADMVATFLERVDDRLDVKTTTSAERGLRRLADGQFDCVVSDYDMPGKDGIELLEAIREKWLDLPFILYTGKGSEEIASKAISAGATDYLQKQSGTDQYRVLANRITNAFERFRTKQELQRKERRYQATFNDPNILAGVLDTDGTLLEQNQTGLEYVDVDADEVVGEPFWETAWWSDEMQPIIRNKIEQAAAGEYVEYAADLTIDDSEYYSVQGTIRPVTDEDGAVCSLIVSARDVTEQETRDRILSTILENTIAPLFMKDRDGKYIIVNRGFRELFDLKDEEVVGKTDTDILPPEHAAMVQRHDRTVIEQGEPIETEERIVVNGKERVFMSSKVPVYDIGERFDPENPVAVLGVATDITERKQHRQKLERQNERLNTVASVISDDLETPLDTVRERIESAQTTGEKEHFEAALAALDRVDELREDAVETLRDR